MILLLLEISVIPIVQYFFLALNFCSLMRNISSWYQTDEGEDDLKKGTQLLEIYALEIQMYTAQKNNKKLKVRTFSKG